MENMPASVLVVPLEKTLSEISSSWRGKQVASNSYARARYSALIASRDRRIKYANKYIPVQELQHAR